MENLTGTSNVTVAYSVGSGSTVFMTSVVIEALAVYGIDKLMTDIRQFVPLVQSLSIPVAPWRPSPAISLQLKTLRFVGPGENIKSCSFSQLMERRLELAFAEAESKVLNSNSKLTVQILGSSRALSSPAVSLIYVVLNGSVPLNGTTSSSLLNQLTAEMVGYFLLFPPLIIAELEYHNLNTSTATRDYWVITIQDVDNSSLEGNYQSFASLMEQRLAEVFVITRQQGTRFRRATTVGGYTVQMVGIRRVPGSKNPAEMTYYVQLNGIPMPGTSAAKILNTVDSQTMALTLGYFVQLQAEAVVKNPPNNLWIIAAILAPIAVVTVIIIIITAVLCRKNKGDFKADTMGNLNPRSKPVQGFDYAKQHLGQQGGDEEALPVTQETMVLPLPIRDAPLSQERGMHQDGTTSKKTLSSEVRKPYDSSSGSLQLISIKPMAAQPAYSHPPSSDRSQDSAIINGEVSMALKQKSDIEHYRNKLRLKAKRKGYYDFPAINSGYKSGGHRQRYSHEKLQLELSMGQDADDEKASTYVKSR
uniref:KIAA1549 like n=1 Tax=Paramormyrops kingsleyae TaxID=1676925 RepID=A0A3B3QN18_9TELE